MKLNSEFSRIMYCSKAWSEIILPYILFYIHYSQNISNKSCRNCLLTFYYCNL